MEDLLRLMMDYDLVVDEDSKTVEFRPKKARCAM